MLFYCQIKFVLFDQIFLYFFINFILKNSPEYHIFFHASIRCFLFPGQNLLKCFQKQAFSIIIVRGQITNGGIPMILSCQNICKSFGEKIILKDASFHIEDREKAALIGNNGAGKTTLLRIIMHELSPDSGNVVLAKDKNIGYLAQYQDIHGHHTIYEELISTKQHKTCKC